MPEKKDEVKSTEYPKSLYAGGDRNSAHRIVNDDEEEIAARKEGFAMIDKTADAKAKVDLGLEEAVEAEEPAPAAKGKKGK